jgi:hypothetical protein
MPNLPDQASSDKLMPGDAARMVGVTTKTLAAMKSLHPIILPSGHRRYLRSEIEALMQERAA